MRITWEEHWELSGWTPYWWQLARHRDSAEFPMADIQPFPARVPGSVAGNLRARGLIADYSAGFRARTAEWTENRDWLFRTRLRVAAGPGAWQLVCPGLDGPGTVYWDGVAIGDFDNSHIEHRFSLPESAAGEHELALLFVPPPRWAGQFGYTSRMPVTKTRFYYTWDWTGRVVQTGITAPPYLDALTTPAAELTACWTALDETLRHGRIHLKGRLRATQPGRDRLTVTVRDGDGVVLAQELGLNQWRRGVTLALEEPALWQPNGAGERRLYTLEVRLNGEVAVARRIGFKHVRWAACQDAPAGAEPWVCVVNRRPTFLQGVNWTPLRPLTAELGEADYRRVLEIYRDMGVNILRVWGGASREKEIFYRLCDEYGFLIWQEFPLSSSGLDNRPPSGAKALAAMRRIAGEYLAKLPGHPCLLFWSGGNELMADAVTPCTTEAFPLLVLLRDLVARHDPTRRFVPTSAGGPYEWFEAAKIGSGEMHDVHGPWKCDGSLATGWDGLWERGDALFHSEFGCPGAASAALIRRYADGEDLTVTQGNAYLNYPSPIWNETNVFIAEHGRPPEQLEEYVAWSQERQSRALEHAAACAKGRFPACGGVIVWMGHDSFPCALNTSLIDFDGTPKPAVAALRRVFLSPVRKEQSSCEA